MKILHTADWHLGQSFIHFDRNEEHQLALDWLLDLIKKEGIELLIIAGDVFDIGSPPNYARRMYYSFLTQLLATNCKNTVIIGGNHDSPSMLDAPRDLLDSLNIKVISAASDRLQDEIIEIKNAKNELQAVIAAVPFLRDRDLKSAVAFESGYDKAEQIKKGIYQHYHDVADWCKDYKKVPIIATGHLFAKGSQASEKQDNIYLGNMENISGEQFPKVFDYVALGHIHRAQVIENQEHIRYSGSLIPLSFSENQDRKSVTIVDFKGKKIEKIQEIDVPSFRKLLTFKGEIDDIKEKITKFDAKLKLQLETDFKLKAWVEIIVESETITPNLEQEMQFFCKEMHLEILKFRTVYKNQASFSTQFLAKDLKELTEMEVFQQRLQSVPEEEHAALTDTFRELYEMYKLVD
jgi:exonuclease SbcD